MIKASFISLLTLISYFNCYGQQNVQDADSAVVIETRALNNFDKIIVSRGINVTLEEGLSPQAEIRIKNATPDDVILVQEGMTVTIKMRPKIYKEMAVNVFITLGTNPIREINAGTGGSVYSEIELEGDQLKLEAGADASIQLQVAMKKVVVNTSAATIHLTGTSDFLDITASAAGRFDGLNLETGQAAAKANMGSKIYLWVTQKLEAKSATGGKIGYTGNPEKVEIKTSLGGTVEEIE
ncbi:GIN domain-containing protein [Geofilum sp. OHC36d9]|uniref:GIN domain-containing protein n=1 Tax=Geofilum sp. OHC36d9 TaxID=3458413 RepID=UPI004033688B